MLTANTKQKSFEFAKKAGIVHNTRHVLLPKSTGLFHILRCLKTEFVYDFTIGYSGVGADDSAYDNYSPTAVFFEGKGPKSINIHVDRLAFRI